LRAQRDSASALVQEHIDWALAQATPELRVSTGAAS